MNEFNEPTVLPSFGELFDDSAPHRRYPITTENIAPNMPTTDQLGYGGADAGYKESYGDDAPADIA